MIQEPNVTELTPNDPRVDMTLDHADMIPVNLSICLSPTERETLLHKLVPPVSTPRLSVEANEYRRHVTSQEKESFQTLLLGELRARWANPVETESQFLKLVDMFETDGCAVVSGLIGDVNFSNLIQQYTKAMNAEGSSAFLHSFINLAKHPEFLTAPAFNGAFAHPLLVAVMAYTLGGPIRMTDARGKDTEPISVNAQENMLHIDNSPFREEYKILVCWERGAVQGPNGQNFAFLPGTHKGNRRLRFDAAGQPWSSENDSVFLCKDAVDSLFAFQKSTMRDNDDNSPTVVEVRHPERPISILFTAGALVHHRYRNQDGKPRSCVVVAFHLAADNPGVLCRHQTCDQAHVETSSLDPPQTVADLLVNHHQDGSNQQQFVSLVVAEADLLASRLAEIYTVIPATCSSVHDNTRSIEGASLVDTRNTKLSGLDLERWRNTVIKAPTTTSIRLNRGVILSSSSSSSSSPDIMSREHLAQNIARVMMYDKHGMLDLILYPDGREEVRKPARKAVWSLSENRIVSVVLDWIPQLRNCDFVRSDVLEPVELRKRADHVAALAFSSISGTQAVSDDDDILFHRSCAQLLVDLGESVVRCERMETYVSTNLFLFWTVHHLLPALEGAAAIRTAVEAGTAFLRCYLASVLITETI